MTQYVDFFRPGPDGSLGKALANGQSTAASASGADAPAASAGMGVAPVLNALLPNYGTSQSAPPSPSPAAITRSQLRSAISHAASLSDTPEKWDATLAMLHAAGIDPAGYEDFETGRAHAMAAAVPQASDAVGQAAG